MGRFLRRIFGTDVSDGENLNPNEENSNVQPNKSSSHDKRSSDEYASRAESNDSSNLNNVDPIQVIEPAEQANEMATDVVTQDGREPENQGNEMVNAVAAQEGQANQDSALPLHRTVSSLARRRFRSFSVDTRNQSNVLPARRTRRVNSTLPVRLYQQPTSNDFQAVLRRSTRVRAPVERFNYGTFKCHVCKKTLRQHIPFECFNFLGSAVCSFECARQGR